MLLPLYDGLLLERQLGLVLRSLEQGRIIVYPTDSVYAFGCDAGNRHAVEQICRLRHIGERNPQLAILCSSISQIRSFTLFDDATFRLMRSCLPGPYTFILEGSSRLPKLYRERRTIWVRIPARPVVGQLVEAFGRPLMTASLRAEADHEVEYMTDPSLIQERYGSAVAFVLDGGIGGTEPSSVIDCTGDEPVVVRGHLPD